MPAFMAKAREPVRAPISRGYLSCPLRPSVPHTSPPLAITIAIVVAVATDQLAAAATANRTTTVAMKKPGWFKKSKNNHEAGGSGSSGRRRQASGMPAFRRGVLPPSPRAQDFVGVLIEHWEEAEPARDRRYFRVAECERR